MTLQKAKEEASKRAREIDQERQEVLSKLFFARSEVAQLEITARKLGKDHLQAVHDSFRIEDIGSETKPDTKNQETKILKKAIFQAFKHLEISPFQVPHFFQTRAVIIWWISREIPGLTQKHLFQAWKEIVGAQESAKAPSLAGIVKQVKNPVNYIVKEYKKKITGQVLSETHQEHQESTEPCQPRS